MDKNQQVTKRPRWASSVDAEGNVDWAHDADMTELHNEQLRADVGDEELEDDEWDDDDDLDPTMAQHFEDEFNDAFDDDEDQLPPSGHSFYSEAPVLIAAVPIIDHNGNLTYKRLYR